jgi:hypothetical protein
VEKKERKSLPGLNTEEITILNVDFEDVFTINPNQI